MAMHGFTYPEVSSFGAGFECGRVSVGITFGSRISFLHLGIKQKRFIGEAIANEPNNNCIPKNSSWARKSIKQLACEVGLAFLAELAQAGANCGFFRFWDRDGRGLMGRGRTGIWALRCRRRRWRQ